MFRTKIGMIALVAAVPGMARATEREPEVIARAGKWEVNYDRDSCHLLARFGEGDKGLVAMFTRYQPGDSFDLALYGKRLPTFEIDARVGVDVNFGLSTKGARHEAMLGRLGKLPLLMFTSLRIDDWTWRSTGDLPPPITPQQEAAVTGATFDIDTRRPFRLEFGSLGKPMELMRSCQVDLIRHWGYDPEVQSHLSRPATPTASPGSWLHNDDYPHGAIAAGNNGVVQFRLDIDPEGKVANCVTLFRTKPDVFGDATCKAIGRRARFTPALDAEGKPARSFYINKVRWLMGS